MAGLNDLNENTPNGLASPTQGDDELRAIKAKVKEYAAAEHSYNGRHKFPTVSVLPANDGDSRRLVIKTTIGQPDELYYDNGTTWVKITSNADIADAVADLLAHQNSNPIDHADASITSAKYAPFSVDTAALKNGAILCRHFDAAQAAFDDSTAPLVNGSDLDATWHTHSQYAVSGGGGSSGINFLSSILSAASGSGGIGWTTINANSLSGGTIPVTARAIILSISLSLINSGFGGSATGVIVNGRKAVGSPSVTLCQYKVPTAVTSDSLFSVQAVCQMTGTDGKFDYSVTTTDAFVGTWDISVLGYYA